MANPGGPNAVPFTNIYHHRKVAAGQAKACLICYKPSSSVMVTVNNKDFFYICPGHLKDRTFCTPIIDEKAEAEKKKKAELDAEIEKVKKEYEEKLKKRAEKKKKAKKDKDKDDKDKKDDKDEEEDKKDEKEKDEKIAALSKDTTSDDEPRIFELKRTFYQSRLSRLAQAEAQRRNRERLQDPSFFPSVPKGDVGKPPAPPAGGGAAAGDAPAGTPPGAQ